MKAVTGKEMGAIDKYSIEQIGIPGIVLMENAALKIVKHVVLHFQQKPDIPKKVVVVAGKGNNAGDAFTTVRHLISNEMSNEMEVKLYCLFDKESITGDARINFDILERIGADIRYLADDTELNEFEADVKSSQLTLDGIFGTGFRGEIQESISKVINIINRYSKFTLSIDIASGTEAASGRTAHTCIQAHKTVTFELPKIGQLIYPGAQAAGELVIESIGMPAESVESLQVNTNLVDRDLVKSFFPKRNSESNKGDYGKVTIVTGSVGMAGSGCLTAKACLKSGSGLVYLAVPSNLAGIYQNNVPEAVLINLEDSKDYISEKDINTIIDKIKKIDVVAIGPGLSQENQIYNIIYAIAGAVTVPVVLDADGLNAAARNIELLKKFKGDVVITPHPGEMARMTGLEISYIQRNRIDVARKYAAEWGVVVVLKGAKTIIADKSGAVYINPTGNSGMATAGSGDSLTGIITSFIGQGASTLNAAVSGVYIHGLAGDLAAGKKGEYGMTAMDIVKNVPYAIKDIFDK